MTTIVNPVLAGMHPDPSWIWDESRGEAVLVNSSFELTPGLPIHVSKDLAHWTHLTNVADGDLAWRLFLDVARDSGGLYAPTLRRIRGRYVIVCSTMRIDGAAALAAGHTQDELDALNAAGGNFVIVADSLGGPWEGPYWVAGAQGIDPDIFEDRDGTVYWTQTRPARAPQWDGQTEVWTQPIDPETWRLTDWPRSDGDDDGDDDGDGDRLSGKMILWRGYGMDAVWAEGPHLYRFGGDALAGGPDADYVYLMTAEGGTGPEHSEMIMRAHAPEGLAAAVRAMATADALSEMPGGEHAAVHAESGRRLFRACKRNPILTHRHLGADYPVQCVGHADLLRKPDGSWWLTCLGVRESAEEHVSYFGRETFIAPVTWESGWPVVAPGLGRLPERIEIADGAHADAETAGAGAAVEPEWLSVRCGRGDSRRYVRVDADDFVVSVPAERSLFLRQDDRHGVDVTVDDDGRVVVAVRGDDAAATDLGAVERLVSLGLRLHGDRLTVFASLAPVDGMMDRLAAVPEDAVTIRELDAAFLSTDRAGGFVGCIVGTECR